MSVRSHFISDFKLGVGSELYCASRLRSLPPPGGAAYLSRQDTGPGCDRAFWTGQQGLRRAVGLLKG